MAAELNIVVRSKRVPWVEDLPVEGPDYSAGTFLMEIRSEPGDTGAPLVSLGNAAAGSEGISCAYDAAYPDPENAGETLAASVFLFQIDEATMAGLSTGGRTSDPVLAYYDLHVTPSGGVKFVLCYGSFTYYPGVTR
jgi:hypothetical protein